MTVHIQSRSENHINIFFCFLEQSSLKNRELRSAMICKSNPSIYLGGHVSIKGNKLNFDSVNRIDFFQHKIDFSEFQKRVIHHLGL